MMPEVKNMDCMEAMKGFPDKFFDLAIVDPPYASNSGNAFTSRLKRYGDLSYNDNRPSKEYFEELFRVSKNQIIWGGNYFIDNLFPTKCMIAWYKHQPVETYADIEIAWTSFQERHSQMIDLPYFGAHGKDPKARVHPNQKPIKLYKKLLYKYATCDTCSNHGDVPSLSIDCDVQTCPKCKGVMAKILDTHLGSGSSRIAAHDMGFEFYGYELDKNYFNAQEQRFKEHIAQLTLSL